jgi:PAS domain S-box-containing protein
LYANDQVEAVLGFERKKILGMKVSELYWDPTIREIRAADIDENGYLDRIVTEMRRADGTMVPTVHSLRSIEFDGGPAIVGAFMDITEQQKNELELRRARDRAEDANGSKTQFLAVMSHELRTPLNAIIGFSDMMQQEVFGPMGHERYGGYVKDIYQSGKHLSDLLSDILDLSRIEAGHLERDETVFDLSEIIGECIGFIRGRATEYGVIVRRSAPDPCPRLKADKRQLKQILLNLLTNAVKFTGPGTVVHLYVETAESGDLILRIKDQGAGIAEEDLERIMEPFTRLAGPQTSGVEGTGLGLAIVKRLVEGHGGSLQLVSKLGQGTDAIVTLPAARIEWR